MLRAATSLRASREWTPFFAVSPKLASEFREPFAFCHNSRPPSRRSLTSQAPPAWATSIAHRRSSERLFLQVPGVHRNATQGLAVRTIDPTRRSLPATIEL